MKVILDKPGLDILKTIASIIDIEEREKLYHSWRVAIMSKLVSEQICKESVLSIYIAGLLHEVGTFDIPNRVIHHKDHMEDINVAAVRTHTQKGAAIVASLPGFIPIAKIVLDHHEWISGEGYPRGLKQNEISVNSQILRVADKVAFLIDTNMVKDISELSGKLKDRIGREFSKDLYECLIKQLQKNDVWQLIIDTKKLSDLTEEVSLELPIKKDVNLYVDRNLVSFFGRVLDAKHSYTEGHSRRVAYFSVLIAIALDLPDREIENIELAAFLHDIGKVGIPKSILDNRGKLTSEEFEVIKKHASFSYEIVKGISSLEKLSHVVGADQEHWDGSGYPKGLKMEEIPVQARIVFIADAFDAMTSNRNYHKAISAREAIKELKKCSGKDFDPEIVDVACKLFEGFENSSVLACYIDKD
jgi:HD-GYP domain-containing protein (c-di-GMP phosphodiesterase class II)